jgi:hypothetical protein
VDEDRGEDAERGLRALLGRQSGVVSRRQALACGMAPYDLERLLRRRELARVVPGVFVDHTGELAWQQRAWAGCLAVGGAALAGSSALRATVGPGWRHHRDDGPVHLVVDQLRRCVAPPGYRLERRRGVEPLVRWNASPPRMRLEPAALDVVALEPDPLRVVGLLADLCQTRHTTADRLLEAARGRARLPRRDHVEGVLADLATGACSTLEHGYLVHVERAHGLPVGVRQLAGTSTLGGVWRDVDYEPLPVRVELDGRLFHDTAEQRDRDLDRDLDSAVDGRRSIRLGWGQVFERPCRTAERVGLLLRRAGWTGQPRPCGQRCALRTAAA